MLLSQPGQGINHLHDILRTAAEVIAVQVVQYDRCGRHKYQLFDGLTVGIAPARCKATVPLPFLKKLIIIRGMPSFDIVSEVNPMELQNAINQAQKELANRFDFKGSKAEILLEKNEIKLSAGDQFKMKALVEIVIGKIAKRNISLKSVDQGEPDLSPLGHARQAIKIKQGIETPIAKEICQFIKGKGLKVTTQIQEQQVRVTGKSRDDLQDVIAAVRAHDFPVAVNFQNFRD